MGNLLPTPSTNPSDTENPTPSSSPTPQSTQTEEQCPESKTQDPAMDDPKTLENHEKSINTEEKEVASEEDEDGECGFCIYMKGGGCRETFTAWEDCVKKNKGDDVVDKCFEITGALKECMEAHSDYYSPVLRAEKAAAAADEEAVTELEREINAEEGAVVSSDDRSSSMEEEGSNGS
ncbi:hypothetical protein RHSIM_RhsimUnG0183500 [Rhododendron simsii]|uniref:GCK domain-containing protein n=1 Tax=Rhododendron simsii TaxID=118357 RepID=A0A834L473_RHOSS|nr:hypothetical protein RHSIM_RhsimUnG0183500 [Rhododendron simsii]